jgi:hypothetical protein
LLCLPFVLIKEKKCREVLTNFPGEEYTDTIIIAYNSCAKEEEK